MEFDTEILRIREILEAVWNEEQALFAIIIGEVARNAWGLRWDKFEEVCKVPNENAYRVPANYLQRVQDLYRGIVAPGALDRVQLDSQKISSAKFQSQRLAYICQTFLQRTMPQPEFQRFVEENPLKFPLKFYRDLDEWLEDPGSTLPLIGPNPFVETSVFVQP